jgi:hypothetical protein
MGSNKLGLEMKKGKNVLQDGLINSYSDNNLYIRHANK